MIKILRGKNSYRCLLKKQQQRSEAKHLWAKDSRAVRQENARSVIKIDRKVILRYAEILQSAEAGIFWVLSIGMLARKARWSVFDWVCYVENIGLKRVFNICLYVIWCLCK